MAGKSSGEAQPEAAQVEFASVTPASEAQPPVMVEVLPGQTICHEQADYSGGDEFECDYPLAVNLATMGHVKILEG